MHDRAARLLFALGMLGVLSFAPALPGILARARGSAAPGSVPAWALTVIALLQASLVVWAAAVLGARLGPALGFHSSLLGDDASLRTIRVLVTHGVPAGAVIGGVGGAVVARDAPAVADYLRTVPIAARLLYGGFTEEIIMRWGLLTTVVWVLHTGSSKGPPTMPLVLASTVLTNLLFAAGHIPLMRAVQTPRASRAAIVIFVATLPWGLLFWTCGIESAMVAHVSFHIAHALTARRPLPG